MLLQHRWTWRLTRQEWPDPIGWLYAARGYYKLGMHHRVIEAVQNCLRNEKTKKEAQHLMAFSLMHTQQPELAATALMKSVQLGNDSDWQPLVEMCLENPKLSLTS